MAGAADCAARAQQVGVKAFSLGIHTSRGWCFAEGLDVTDSMLTDFKKDLVGGCTALLTKNLDIMFPIFVRALIEVLQRVQHRHVEQIVQEVVEVLKLEVVEQVRNVDVAAISVHVK